MLTIDHSCLIFGVDPSLTGTAICVWDPMKSEMLHVETFDTKKIMKDKKFSKDVNHIRRMRYIRDSVFETIDAYRAQYKYDACPSRLKIFIEGYAYAAKGSVFDMGELGGILRMMFFEKFGGYFDVSPASLKKFITGNGKSKKEVMLERTFRKYGLGSDTLTDNNMVDAYGLARVGEGDWKISQNMAVDKYEKETILCKLAFVYNPKVLG